MLDGVPAGNFQFKAHVVQDIYQLFDTHAIAGVKMSEKLSGMKFAGKPVELNTEPTKKDAKKKKSKVKGSVESSPTSSRSGSESRSLTPSSPPTATPTRPVIQGRWIKKQWVPHPYTFPDEFATWTVRPGRRNTRSHYPGIVMDLNILHLQPNHFMHLQMSMVTCTLISL